MLTSTLLHERPSDSITCFRDAHQSPSKNGSLLALARWPTSIAPRAIHTRKPIPVALATHTPHWPYTSTASLRVFLLLPQYRHFLRALLTATRPPSINSFGRHRCDTSTLLLFKSAVTRLIVRQNLSLAHRLIFQRSCNEKTPHHTAEFASSTSSTAELQRWTIRTLTRT